MYKIIIFVTIIITYCQGLGEPHLQGRIYGGEIANISDFPYQVELERANVFVCAASIISDTWIITAAHCFENIEASQINIRAGSSTRGSGGTLYDAISIVMNPNYDSSHNYDGDIALIKVSPPFEYKTEVQPIEIIESEPKVGEMATISGWGSEIENDVLSPYLRYVSVPIVDHQDCELAYSQRQLGEITSNMICAGLKEGGKDACTGDRGGALVVRGKLAGIVSFGIGCGTPEFPGVYTNVFQLRDFILLNTGV